MGDQQAPIVEVFYIEGGKYMQLQVGQWGFNTWLSNDIEGHSVWRNREETRLSNDIEGHSVWRNREDN